MAERSRPNILWISFEDTNPYYGCYGDKVARTPAVDRLASEGCLWTRAFSTAGVCAPARSAVITGMYPATLGTHHMRTAHTHPVAPELPTPYSAVIPHYAKCFSEYLRAAGYYCTNNVKTDYQFDPPFTAWDDLSEEAHWRNRPDTDQPFFAVFNPTDTHESGMWEGKVPDPSFEPKDVELPPYFPDTPKVRRAMARMHHNIEYCDRIMGRLLGQLEEDGLAENTIVFHWSDHGPLPRGKRWPYDSGIRVPMIARWPGHIEPGTVCEDLISTVDLAPTVMSLVGLDVPAHMQGQPFLGEQAEPRQCIYATRDRYDESYDMVRAVRDQRFKYIRNYRPEQPYLLWIPFRNRHPIIQEMWRLHMEGELDEAQSLMFQYPRPVEELYDTQADPFEIHNLASDPKFNRERSRLRAELDRWRAEADVWGDVPESEMVRQWYPDGKQPRTASPVPIPICDDAPGIQPAQDGDAVTVQGPAHLQLYCATQGASIGYTTESGDAPAWQLYTEPLVLCTGRTTIRVKAIRIGYAESDETTVTLDVVP